MKNVTSQQFCVISGGWNYTVPQSDMVPEKAAFAYFGGHANYALSQSVGIDITGDKPEYNMWLGVFIPPMGLMILAVQNQSGAPLPT
jgi:hypothetical protein